VDDSYSLALAVQDASNISGVSHDLSKLVTMIRAEYERDNNGQITPTSYISQHPAMFIYVAKIMDLMQIHLDTDDMDKWIDAYHACQEKAKTKWHVSRAS